MSFDGVDSRYVDYYLKSSTGRQQIESRASGNQVSMRNISQKSFRDINIPVPPVREQHEIVRRINGHFMFAKAIETKHERAIESLRTLQQSILSKAFAGELGTSNSGDEPATALIKRIREVRGSAGHMNLSRNRVKRTSTAAYCGCPGPFHFTPRRRQ